jgi:hypothetical protein
MKIFKNYGLTIVLLILFLSSWAGQWYFQWQEFESQQQAHGQQASVDEFIPEFWKATLENWQSEFLQLLSFVVLTSFLSHKGSPESKSSDEEMEKRLIHIEGLLKNKK